MLTAFWEGLGGKLGERGSAGYGGPLLVLLAGWLAWTYHRHGLTGLEPGHWKDRSAELTRLEASEQLLLVLLLMLLAYALGVVGRRLSVPLLRLLEGYWPARAAQPLAFRRFERRQADRTAATQLHRAHAAAPHEVAARQRMARLARLERRIAAVPADPDAVLPTRLGNLLRTAEEGPRHRYGIDPVVCWPHLWLLLDDGERAELTAARGTLQAATGSFLWGLALLLYVPLAWWMLLLAPIVCALSYYGTALAAARTYRDLVLAATDLHRFDLYAAVHWPPPADPSQDVASGRALTEFLRRGIPPKDLRYADGSPGSAAGS
ncbi:hypothetical protein [Kitasatospora viridis]|uniref:Uncharacterized protein n=1 Tax=Kitasatospora viridis TaxID=281105 RepID=A0A561TSF5_9ACTN|nr:hypothetical protein [Kitasatospora viridis]TWF90044.1 hypothetical protein FHX73_1388 [Kitasatospora viridis]